MDRMCFHLSFEIYLSRVLRFSLCKSFTSLFMLFLKCFIIFDVMGLLVISFQIFHCLEIDMPLIFCVDFVSCCFAELAYQSNRCFLLFLEYIEFYLHKIMLFMKRDNFIVSFPIWMPLTYFFLPNYSGQTFSTTMLSKSDKSGHPYLLPDLRGKAFRLSPLSMMFPVSLSHVTFIISRQFPSVPNLLSVFIMTGY